MENIHLGIIEDDEVIKKNLITYLQVNPSIKVENVAGSVEDFLEQVSDTSRPQLDLILLDIGLPGMSGIKGIPHIREYYPKTDIVMLTTYEEDDKIFPALCAGACAYISKRTSLSVIRDAVFTIHRGGSYMSPSIARKVAQHFMPKKQVKKHELTPRQQQIVDGLVKGLTYQAIADSYNISVDTVRDHIRRIYRLLDVNTRMGVVRKSIDGEI